MTDELDRVCDCVGYPAADGRCPVHHCDFCGALMRAGDRRDECGHPAGLGGAAPDTLDDPDPGGGGAGRGLVLTRGASQTTDVSKPYTVKRPDLFGAVHDTYQTERELNGIRETNGRLF